MTTTQLHESAAMAEDLNDLLSHLAWTDVLKPAMLKSKSQIAQRLANAVLGTAGTNEACSAQQLAGMTYGIDLVISTIEGILRKGVTASESLRAVGFQLR